MDMKQRKIPFWRQIWQKLHPRMPDFHGMLVEQCDSLIQALDALEDYLGDNRPEKAIKVRNLVDKSHALAHAHLDALHRTFVTPIDREDIYAVITGIDHVFDYLATSVREIELLDIPGDRWMQKMILQLQQGATALGNGFRVFRTDPAAGGEQGEGARLAERNVEELYRQALDDMFGGKALEELRDRDKSVSSIDCLDYVFTQMKRREVYRHLSNTADRLANVGELLHDLGVKYD
jgi:uncharacterized protein Yka (UPF0111/DUF47 family)